MKIDGRILGSDGCGTIIEVGEDVSQDLIGKKVAFLWNGYARYTVQDVRAVLRLDDS